MEPNHDNPQVNTITELLASESPADFELPENPEPAENPTPPPLNSGVTDTQKERAQPQEREPAAAAESEKPTARDEPEFSTKYLSNAWDNVNNLAHDLQTKFEAGEISPSQYQLHANKLESDALEIREANIRTRDRENLNQQQHVKNVRQAHERMIDLVPEWSVPDKREAMQARSMNIMLQAGFSEAEANDIQDPRVMSLLVEIGNNRKLKSEAKKRRPPNKRLPQKESTVDTVRTASGAKTMEAKIDEIANLLGG